MHPRFMTRPGIWVFIALSLLASVATAAAADAPADQPANLYDRLDLFACPDLSYLVYGLIPDFFYRGEADSLAELISYWDMACGPAEPIERISILGAIWDDAFDESLYNSTIIHDLIWRYDPVRLGEKPDYTDPDLAPGGVARPMDFVANRDAFDAFTASLADQLLPHVPRGSVQEFFCLFYAGQTAAAWELLRSDALVGTDLRWYYDTAVHELRTERWVPSVALTGGYWLREGRMGPVGNHATVGFLGAMRDQGWLFRLALEVRLGRTDRPYYVSKGEVDGWSDRFNAVFATLDLGRSVLTVGRSRFDVYGGLGVLSLKPFADSELTLNGLAYTLGAGYRYHLGKRGRWFLGADGQREWISDLDTGGTVLEGGGWNWRLAVGVSFNAERDRRLSGLGE